MIAAGSKVKIHYTLKVNGDIVAVEPPPSTIIRP